jgi:hypothetical protein
MRSVFAAGFASARRLRVAALAAALPWPCAASADDATIARVLAGLGADRTDVRVCLGDQMRSDPQKRGEIERLSDVLGWINAAVTLPRHSGSPQDAAMSKERSDAFVEIVATFNHERRIDGGRLAFLSNGQLTPQHVSTYARVQRALGSGHDAKRVMCGL